MWISGGDILWQEGGLRAGLGAADDDEEEANRDRIPAQVRASRP